MKTAAGKSLIRLSLNIIFYSAVFAVTGYACLWCYHFMYLAFSNPICKKEPVTECQFQVTAEEAAADVMLRLQQEGIVENGYAACLRLYCSQYEGVVKPGQYDLSSDMPLDDILAILAQDTESEQGAGIETE